MMIDWFVLLTPLVLLPILLLFVFVGCQLVFGIDEDPIPVALEISSGCDNGISSISAVFTALDTDLDVEKQIQIDISPVPSAGTTISTLDVVLLADEGSVRCDVTLTPVKGDKIGLSPALHDKLEDEGVEPFTLFCIADGTFELS